jgi:hypothetical protein
MLIEFVIAAARSVPDKGDVSMASEHAKSNLEEGLIRKVIPQDKAFPCVQNGKKKTGQLA